MNTKRIILSCLLLLFIARLFGQHIEFTYDENGNRKSRQLVVQQLKSATIKFPVTDPKTLEFADNSKKGNAEDSIQKLKGVDGEIQTFIYPNPTKGFLKVEITNMPLEASSELKVYDMSGSEVIDKRIFDSLSEVDLSHLKDGIYILRIKVNDRFFNWKIVKNNY
jgi:hypothetical protein